MASADVTRIVCLAFLAPDIAKRIAQGRASADARAKRLLAMAPLPRDWSEQRRLLGFEG